MTIKYDPKVVQQYSRQQYGGAKWRTIVWPVLGLAAGGAIGYGLFKYVLLKSAGFAGTDALIGTTASILTGTAMGGYAGYVFGKGKAVTMQGEAQNALCMTQIEKNMRDPNETEQENAADSVASKQIEYDSDTMEQYSHHKYRAARIHSIAWPALGLAVGGALGLGLFKYLIIKGIVTNIGDYSLGSALLGGAIGGFIGFRYGRGKSIALRVQAQNALCMTEIEKNMREVAKTRAEAKIEKNLGTTAAAANTKADAKIEKTAGSNNVSTLKKAA